MVNWDDVLSYNTVKIVTLRDHRLGILHYLFMFSVILYVAFYAIYWNQGYLRKEVPVGGVRATIMHPNTFLNATEIPYCLENQPTLNGVENLPCVYMSGNDVAFPAGQVSPLFVTTRTKTFTRTAPADCNPPSRPECIIMDSSDPSATTRYYVAGIEDFTVYIDHVAYGLTNDFAARSNEMKGEVWRDGKKLRDLEKNTNGDIFKISDLLWLAGINSLDEKSRVSDQSLRYDGVYLMVTIEYFNSISKSTDLTYKIKVRSVKGEDTTRFDSDTPTTSSNRHGIVITFVQTGMIGIFNFPTLLSSIIGGLVLTRIATTVVDLLAFKILPEKKIYNPNVYQKTPLLKDMRKAALEKEQNELPTFVAQ